MPKHSLCILIPIKPIAQAKGRLRSSLTSEQRRALVSKLLQHVLDATLAITLPKRVIVLAGDSAGAELARRQGVEVLPESGRWRLDIGGEDVTPVDGDEPPGEAPVVEVGLNRILADALAWVEEQGYETALILPADLPLLTPKDIRSLWYVSQRTPRPHVVLAPDREEQGTNALLLSPPTLISPSFGRGSFKRHVDKAYRVGAAVRVYISPGFAHDVDAVEDWQHLSQFSHVGQP